MRVRSLGVAMVILLAAMTMAAGSALAHTCQDYDGCDAGACKDGEDHEHTDMNYVGRDGYCKSTSKPPPDPESCEYFGLTWPPLVCDIIEPKKSPPPVVPGVGGGPCTERIDSKAPGGGILAQYGYRLLDGPC